MSKDLREELELVLVIDIFLPTLLSPKSYEFKCPFSYQHLTWHYSLTLGDNGIALSLQTFTGKLNSKLPRKNEDKRGQRHIICSKANYLRSMRKQKRLKYVVLSSMIQEVKVSEEQKYKNTIIPSLLYQL